MRKNLHRGNYKFRLLLSSMSDNSLAGVSNRSVEMLNADKGQEISASNIYYSTDSEEHKCSLTWKN